MEVEKFEYDIGGRLYTQGELVLSQDEEIVKILGPVEGVTEEDLGAAMKRLVESGLVSRALAVVLVPSDSCVADRDIAAEELWIKHRITNGQIAGVIRDFFTCNAGAVKKFAALRSLVEGLATPDP